MVPHPQDPDLILTDWIGPFGLSLVRQKALQKSKAWSVKMEPTGPIQYALIRSYDDTDPEANAFEPGFGFFPGEKVEVRHSVKEAGMQRYMAAVRELIFQLDHLPA
jgi:hypothetical protein